MAVNPKSHREMYNIIHDTDLKAKLDEYFTTRANTGFLSKLLGILKVSDVPGSKYDSTLMSALILYIGTRAIDALQSKKQKISVQSIANSPFMDVFQSLASALCSEGRHVFLNAIVNQLRYPNTHTHYFSCMLLYMFLEAKIEAVQEQITRYK